MTTWLIQLTTMAKAMMLSQSAKNSFQNRRGTIQSVPAAILVTETTDGFYAFTAVLCRAELSSQITHMHIDTAVVRHRFTAQGGQVQVFLLDHFTTALQQQLQDAEFRTGQFF